MSKIYIYSFPILFLLTSCASRTVYLNKSEYYKLVLKSDSTYFFKQPALIHRNTERGTYQIKNDSVMLTNQYENVYDSIAEISRVMFYSDEMDSVTFSFCNINDTAIAVSFRLNNQPNVFSTDRNGNCKLAYKDLAEQKIIDSNRVFYSVDISWENRQYHYTELNYYLSPGIPHLPNDYKEHISFKLNQFAGKKYGYSYRRYAFSRDSIIVNTSTWKGMPKDVALKKR